MRKRLMLFTSNLTPFIRVVALLSALVCIGACSSLKFPGVYKIGILQGNLVDQEKLNQVKKGMTKRQIQFLLGTPLIVDTFNQDRWDYYYSWRDRKGRVAKRLFTAYFEDDTLVRYEGSLKPGNAVKKTRALPTLDNPAPEGDEIPEQEDETDTDQS